MIYPRLKKYPLYLYLAFLLLVPFSASADSIDEAIELERKGRTPQAIAMLTRLLEKGNAVAGNLAGLYSPADRAESYFRRSHELGNTRGTALLGMWLKGKGKKSESELLQSAKLLGTASTLGDELAMREYVFGAVLWPEIFDADMNLVLKWAQKSERSDNASTSVALGELYLRNNTNALALDAFLRAADNGLPFAKYKAAKLMTDYPELSTGEEQVGLLFVEAADAGIPQANIHAYMAVREVNPAKARGYIRYLYEQDDPQGVYAWYFDNLNGGTAPPDLKEAITALEKAAFLGVQKAITDLVYRYKNGVGVDKSLTKALFWLWKLDPEENPLVKIQIEGIEAEIAAIAKLELYDPRDELAQDLYRISASFYRPITRLESKRYLDEDIVPAITASYSGAGSRLSYGNRNRRSMFFSDGTSARISGNKIRLSTGEVWRINGNRVRSTSGVTGRLSTSGRTVRFSDGTNCRSVGRSMFCY